MVFAKGLLVGMIVTTGLVVLEYGLGAGMVVTSEVEEAIGQTVVYVITVEVVTGAVVYGQFVTTAAHEEMVKVYGCQMLLGRYWKLDLPEWR